MHTAGARTCDWLAAAGRLRGVGRTSKWLVRAFRPFSERPEGAGPPAGRRGAGGASLYFIPPREVRSLCLGRELLGSYFLVSFIRFPFGLRKVVKPYFLK